MGDLGLKRGMVHVYTGDGKGKTTAALGVVLRVLGWGGRVCMIQFIKGYSEIGEMRFARECLDRFELKQFAIDSTPSIDEREVTCRREAVEAAMEYAEQVVTSGDYDLVVLDEINNAVHYGLVDVDRVLSLIGARPEDVELILTGRDASSEIIAAAEYVTDVRLVKHPFEKNVPARRGIDY